MNIISKLVDSIGHIFLSAVILMILLICGLGVITLLISHPYESLSFLLGGFLGPGILQRIGICDLGDQNLFSLLSRHYDLYQEKNQEQHTRLVKKHTCLQRREQRLQQKIHQLRKEFSQLDYDYQDFCHRDPDVIRYYQPTTRSLVQKLRYRIGLKGG
jgi:hypothetical protein